MLCSSGPHLDSFTLETLSVFQVMNYRTTSLLEFFDDEFFFGGLWVGGMLHLKLRPGVRTASKLRTRHDMDSCGDTRTVVLWQTVVLETWVSLLWLSFLSPSSRFAAS